MFRGHERKYDTDDSMSTSSSFVTAKMEKQREEEEEEEEEQDEQECGICIERMNTLSFIQPKVAEEDREDVLDLEDPTCMRLKCGHAFHFSCQAPAMRLGKFCSLCRDEVKHFESGTIRQIRIGDEVWEFSPTSETTEGVGEQINQIMQSNQDLENALTSENGTNVELQSCRAKMNEALGVHRKVANDLKKTRAKYLRESLRTFRVEHKNKFDESHLRIKNLLRINKNLEDSILRRRGFTARQIQDYFSSDPRHDLNELVSNGAVGGDPARHRFWYR